MDHGRWGRSQVWPLTLAPWFLNPVVPLLGMQNYMKSVIQGVFCVLEDSSPPLKISPSSWHFSCASRRLFYFSSQQLLDGAVCDMTSGSDGHEPIPGLQVMWVI